MKIAKWIATVALLMSAMAVDVARSHEVSDQVFSRVEHETGVKASLLKAIALRESARWVDGKSSNWAFAIGVNGRDGHFSHYPATRDEAEEMLGKLLKSGRRNIGVGVAQINIRWNGHRVADYRQLFDPYTNLTIAAQLIKDCWNSSKTPEATLSCYANGRLTPFGAEYANKVAALQDGLEGEKTSEDTLETLPWITSMGEEPTPGELLMAYRMQQKGLPND